MTAFPSLLVAGGVVASAVTVGAEARGARRLVYAAKPLATALLLGVALSAAAPPSPSYRLLVSIGILFSLAGDVFLMLPGDRFLPGLVSFLFAHVLYVAAFLGAASPGAPFVAAAAPFALAATALVAWLWPKLPTGLKAPVAVYAAALSSMAAVALARALASSGAGAWGAATGALVFVVSDALLAADRFRGPIPFARPAVLATYYAAQLAIALSVTVPR